MLHFSGSAPDWQAVPRHEWNAWQRLAAHSHGVLTPGNAVSLAGIGLVAAGLACVAYGHYWPGLGLLSAGRVCDILDGFAAHGTGTKSPLGEAVDVLCDKLGAFLALIVLVIAGVVWWPAGLLIGLYNVVNSGIGLFGKRHGRAIHPSAAGKFAAVGQWLALIGLLLAAAWDGPWAAVVRAAAYGVAAAALVLGIYAAAGYVRLVAGRR